MNPRSETLLVWLLRLFGLATLCALPAVFMPQSWMDHCHRRVGLGPLPDAVIVDYLARSLSALYAILGGILLICSSDVRRHASIITYLAVICVVGGTGVTILDLVLDLPWWWTASEGPATIGTGGVMLILQARTGTLPGDRKRRVSKREGGR